MNTFKKITRIQLLAIFLFIFTPVHSFADSIICPVLKVNPPDASVDSTQLKIESQESDFDEGSVLSIVLEKSFADHSTTQQKIYGEVPRIRGVVVSPFSCNPAFEANRYDQMNGRIFLSSRCIADWAPGEYVSLIADLTTSKAGTLRYHYPDGGQTKEVSYQTAACFPVAQ